MARGLGTRVLATVLFTDIVGSTAIAEELDDRRWRELLRRHHAIVRRQLKRFRGREIDTAGDGFLALFDSPAQAVRCACAISDAVRELGIEIRAGLHLGEVELTDGKAQGIAVHIGARILALAKPGDVLVSAPLRSTAAGSGVQFEARGRRRLRGVEGTWQLFAVTAVDGSSREPPLDEAEGESRRAAITPLPAVRRLPTIVGLGLLVVLAIVAAVLISRRGSPAAPSRAGPPTGSLVLIDPATNRVEQVVEGAFYTSVGQGVSVIPQLAAGEGSVWILAGPRVSAIDPTRGERWTTIRLPRLAFGDQGFEVGQRIVWVRNGDQVERINPATGDLLQPARHAEWVGFGGDMAIGLGGVWVGNRSSIYRLDPQTGGVVERIDFPGTLDHLAISDGRLWVADALAGRVFEIDPIDGRVANEIPLSGGMDDLEAAEGYVWVLDTTAGTLTSINAQTGDPHTPVGVGRRPTALAVGLGSVWVALGEEGKVLRINPNTRAPKEIPVNAPVSDLVVDEDGRAVWVTIS